MIIREGHLTSISHLMVKPRAHVFVVVPEEVKELIDWRITTFRCGRNGRLIAAFDGDALLLYEIWRRASSKVS